MNMRSWVIRIEGVNFDVTIGDTNDLSTFRGGSLALLGFAHAAEEALRSLCTKVELVFSGASLCAFRAESSEPKFATAVRTAVREAFGRYGFDAAEWRKQKEPLQFLTVVVDAAETRVADAADPAIDADIRAAEAFNHARQFRQWTIAPLPNVDVPAQAKKEADRYDGVRPAVVRLRAPRERVLHATSEDMVDDRSDQYHASISVAARCHYGRLARQRFYVDELGKSDDFGDLIPFLEQVSFTNSIADIVADPPDGLPLSLGSKIAVVYADGNGFGSLRAKAGIRNFSEQIGMLRTGLLTSTLCWYRSGLTHDDASFNAFAIRSNPSGAERGKVGLRFETLMWGGDELLFVMPSWLAAPFVQGFLDKTKAWPAICGTQVTHALGVVVAHHKTPIRQLRNIAKVAADLSKNAAPGMRSTDSVTFEIYESLAPPDTDVGFSAERLRLYGENTEHGGQQHSVLARFLALPGSRFAACAQRMHWWRDEFPRSQIYGALRMARATGSLWTAAAEETAEAWFKEYARRDPASVARIEEHRLPSIAGEPKRPLPLELAMIATLWDYFTPLPLPPFSQERAS